MSKVYQTKSGTYAEADLVIAIWVNPKFKNSHQARYLETMTHESSRNPLAFPLKDLKAHEAWKHCPVALSATDVEEHLVTLPEGQRASRERPLLIPLPIASEYMGWETFYIPSEYTTKDYTRN